MLLCIYFPCCKWRALSIQSKRLVWIFATSSSEWNSIFQNFLKRRQPREGIPKFSKIFPRSFLSAFNFALEISRIFGWMVRISEIQQLSKFLETFLRNFCTIWHCFQIFESFVWMESDRNFKKSLFLSAHVLARGLAQTQNFSWPERTLNGSSSELFLVMRQHGSEK